MLNFVHWPLRLQPQNFQENPSNIVRGKSLVTVSSYRSATSYKNVINSRDRLYILQTNKRISTSDFVLSIYYHDVDIKHELISSIGHNYIIDVTHNCHILVHNQSYNKEYQIVQKVIVRHDSETIVNFVPKYYCKDHFCHLCAVYRFINTSLMLTYSEILSLFSVYCGVRVARSLVFCVGFLGVILRIFFFFSFGHCHSLIHHLVWKSCWTPVCVTKYK